MPSASTDGWCQHKNCIKLNIGTKICMFPLLRITNSPEMGRTENNMPLNGVPWRTFSPSTLFLRRSESIFTVDFLSFYYHIRQAPRIQQTRKFRNEIIASVFFFDLFSCYQNELGEVEEFFLVFQVQNGGMWMGRKKTITEVENTYTKRQTLSQKQKRDYEKAILHFFIYFVWDM